MPCGISVLNQAVKTYRREEKCSLTPNPWYVFVLEHIFRWTELLDANRFHRLSPFGLRCRKLRQGEVGVSTPLTIRG
jgi:hypothetical protein